MNKVGIIILELSLAVSMLFCFLLFGLTYRLSVSYAANSPQIAYMQYPILSLCYINIIAVIVALLMGLFLVHRSNSHNIFERRTTKMLNTMGNCFMVSFIAVLLIFVYAFVNIQWEIGLVSTYLFVVMLITFLGANVFYFIAYMFGKAVAYREGNELDHR